MIDQYGINHIDTAATYGRSERLLGPTHGRASRSLLSRHQDQTSARTRARRAQIQKSLERLQTSHVDLLQLHNLWIPRSGRRRSGPGGALEAAIEAREQGLTRFIGVTGHGVTVAAMHLRSLERFPFDSVLLPCNVMMFRNPAYVRDFEELTQVCSARGIAMQTIKGITLGPLAAGGALTRNVVRATVGTG